MSWTKHEQLSRARMLDGRVYVHYGVQCKSLGNADECLNTPFADRNLEGHTVRCLYIDDRVVIGTSFNVQK